MKWLHKASEVPTTPHYALLVPRRICIPGDERSRTHPGHGYPESNEDVWEYIVFDSEGLWTQEIEHRVLGGYTAGRDFVAMRVHPVEVTRTVQVKIK